MPAFTSRLGGVEVFSRKLDTRPRSSATTDAEAACVPYLPDVQHGICCGGVGTQHELTGEVVSGEKVTVDDDHALGDRREGGGRRPQPSGRPSGVGLGGVPETDTPAASIAQHGLELVSQVGGGQNDVDDTMRGQPSELVDDERFPRDLQEVLGAVLRQRAHACSESARKDDGDGGRGLARARSPTHAPL